jgi:hypothetical protein
MKVMMAGDSQVFISTDFLKKIAHSLFWGTRRERYQYMQILMELLKKAREK